MVLLNAIRSNKIATPRNDAVWKANYRNLFSVNDSRHQQRTTDNPPSTTRFRLPMWWTEQHSLAPEGGLFSHSGSYQRWDLVIRHPTEGQKDVFDIDEDHGAAT